MTKHIAAWDLPSLDYLSEEQTMKYLKKHEEELLKRQHSYEASTASVGSSAATTPSPSGSLPESERPQPQPRTSKYENKAFSGSTDELRSTVEPKDV